MTQSEFRFFGEQYAYEAPEAVVFDLTSEGILCSSPDRADSGYDPDFDLGEI